MLDIGIVLIIRNVMKTAIGSGIKKKLLSFVVNKS